MNSNNSGTDPRVPQIIYDIFYELIAGLQLSGANIKFNNANQILGSGSVQDSDGNYTATQSQLQNEQIPDQEIDIVKIIGLEDRLDLIDSYFPATITYNEYNEADDTWTTVTKVLSNAASAYTFLTDTLPKAINYGKRIFDLLGITGGGRQYVQLIDEVDNVVSDVAQNVQDIATQTTNNAALQTRVTNVETSTTALQTRATAIETKNTTQDGQITTLTTRTSAVETRTGALETRATAIETKDTLQDTQITAQTTKNTTQDAQILSLQTTQTTQGTQITAAQTSATAANTQNTVQDGLISANTAAAASAAAAAASAQATASGAAATAATVLAALIASKLLSTGSDGNGGTTYVTNTVDLSGVNNNISALQTDNTSNKTFLAAMVTAGYITLTNGVYSLSAGFASLVSGLNTVIQWMLDGGFIISNQNGLLEAPGFLGVMPNITQVFNSLVTSGLLLKTTTNNVSTYSYNTNFTASLPQLGATLTTLGFYTSSTTNGVTTYTPVSGLTNIITTILNHTSSLTTINTVMKSMGVFSADYTAAGFIPSLIDVNTRTNKTITNLSSLGFTDTSGNLLSGLSGFYNSVISQSNVSMSGLLLPPFLESCCAFYTCRDFKTLYPDTGTGYAVNSPVYKWAPFLSKHGVGPLVVPSGNTATNSPYLVSDPFLGTLAIQMTKGGFFNYTLPLTQMLSYNSGTSPFSALTVIILAYVNPITTPLGTLFAADGGSGLGAYLANGTLPTTPYKGYVTSAGATGGTLTYFPTSNATTGQPGGGTPFTFASQYYVFSYQVGFTGNASYTWTYSGTAPNITTTQQANYIAGAYTSTSMAVNGNNICSSANVGSYSIVSYAGFGCAGTNTASPASGSNTTNTLNAAVKDIIIYNRYLTPTEITAVSKTYFQNAYAAYSPGTLFN